VTGTKSSDSLRVSIVKLPFKAPYGSNRPLECEPIASLVSGSVWRIIAEAGQAVKADDAVVVVESMKMEMQVTAPADGTVVELRCGRRPRRDHRPDPRNIPAARR
jgi:biotin carboxyl carrier protein